MKSFSSLLSALNSDDRGAAFIEYTALLGVLLVVGLVTMTAVGTWANNKWALLNRTLN